MKLKIKTLFIVTSIVSAFYLPRISAKDIWAEKEGNAAPIISLPNFNPIIEQLDKAVVNVSSSSDPAKNAPPQQQRRRAPNNDRQAPSDPFSNPEEFFERFFGQPFRELPQQQRRTLGSGFIISSDGYILTNNHVVDGADKVEITILSENKQSKHGNEFQATIVGRDPATDVALLKIKSDTPLPFTYLGNSQKLSKGDWVLAFGNPFGLDHSVSAGIISAVGREISPNENRRFDDFIQTDAAINFGNSGGPLVNLRGEVIGINTAITAQGSGIGFAVPINQVKEIVTQLKDSGVVSRGYLGVMIQDVNDEIKDALGLTVNKGVLINDVVPDGPAAKSSLQRGDVIMKINGTDTPDAKALQKTVAKSKPGASIDVDIIREKKPMKVSVKLGTLTDGAAKDSPEPGEEKPDRLGLIVGMAESVVQIRDVDGSSAAAEAGIAPGDIIRNINNKPVKSIDDYKKIVTSLKSKQTVLFDLERGSVKLFIAFRIS